MLSQNISVFRVLVSQVGAFAALRITIAKGVSRLLTPHAKRYYSQTGEDLILTTLVERFVGRRNFFFVDVGCHDARMISSTYLHYLNGASGINIDLGERYGVGFAQHRPIDRFVCAAASDHGGEATLTEFTANEVNTIDTAQAVQWENQWQSTGKKRIKTHTLDSILKSCTSRTEIDVLLLDVEGHELNVLKGFTFATWKPSVVVCEIHELELTSFAQNAVCSLLTQNGYRLHSYAVMNAYFVRNER